MSDSFKPTTSINSILTLNDIDMDSSFRLPSQDMSDVLKVKMYANMRSASFDSIPDTTNATNTTNAINALTSSDSLTMIHLDSPEEREKIISEDINDIDVRKELFDSIREYPHSTDFQRVIITETNDPIERDTIEASYNLKKCYDLREKWIRLHPYPPQDIHSELSSNISILSKISDHTSLDPAAIYRRRQPPAYDIFQENPIIPSNISGNYEYNMENGVLGIYNITNIQEKQKVVDVLSFDEFIQDFTTIRNAIYSGPLISYSFKKLELLLAKFNLYLVLNHHRELEVQKAVPHRDFYNIRKVDTHVHHSACMNQKHLLRFIKHKLKYFPNEIVINRDGKTLTLGEVFKSLHLTAYDLSIDTLDMHANNTFQRFDRFNLKYNPAGKLS